MNIEEGIRHARERAREMKIDPALTIAEVYEGELLHRLQRKLRGGLVWKGGTVLRLEGSERFSRDLDATRRSAVQTTARIMRAMHDVAKHLEPIAKPPFAQLNALFSVAARGFCNYF